MKIFERILSVFFTAICLVIMGCGGGSLDSETNDGRANVLVHAGNDQTVNEQTVINLNAQASGQTDALTYTWSASPSITITQSDTSSGAATVTTPVTTEEITYTFTVVVLDAEGNRGTDQVVYTVAPVNVLPVANLSVPAYPNLPVNVFPAGETIVLDASGSTDSDGAATSPLIAEYLWQQTAGEPVLSGVSTEGDNLSFTTPILDDANTISFSLTVTDQEGGQSTQTVDLSIQSASQTLPNIAAGIAHEVFSGESILLNGLASTNIAAARPLSATWLNDSELEPVINDVNAVQTYAIAPLVTENQEVTFTLVIQDALGNQVQDSINITIKPLPIQPLNDTGVYQQATNDQVLSTYQSDFPGQDGQKGQDVIHLHGLSAKAGRGEQGFDFTKLDIVGDEVDDPSQDWSCVRDNITGLIWEVKTAANTSGLHSSIHSFTWYQEENNGDFAGDETGLAGSCSFTACQTAEYLTQVNSQGLCNFRDWRLPTHDELLSLVHFGQTTAPMIDRDYFPHTTASLNAPTWYWTQNSSADGISAIGAQNAWAIDFATGNDNFLDKSTTAHIRLVRAGR